MGGRVEQSQAGQGEEKAQVQWSKIQVRDVEVVLDQWFVRYVQQRMVKDKA